MSLLTSGGRIGDLCHFSFTDLVNVEFSLGISSLVLAFDLVFVLCSVYFISVEYILLMFSLNVDYPFILKFIILSISFLYLSIGVMSWGF